MMSPEIPTMASHSVSHRLRALLAEQMARMEAFFTDDVLLLDDLEMDDLDAADFALGLEEVWPDRPWMDEVDLDKLRQLRTFGGLVAYVENELGDEIPVKKP